MPLLKLLSSYQPQTYLLSTPQDYLMFKAVRVHAWGPATLPDAALHGVLHIFRFKFCFRYPEAVFLGTDSGSLQHFPSPGL